MGDERWDRLQEYAEQQYLDALFITDPEDIGFLTGFSRGSLLVIPSQAAYLFVDPAEAAEAHSRASACEVLTADPQILPRYVGRLLGNRIPDRLGYSAQLSQEMFMHLDRNVRQRDLCRQLVVMQGLGRKLRAVKDADYLSRIRRCCRMADRAYERVIRVVQEGMTEHELAAEIEATLRRSGCDRLAFPTVVASGPRSAFPHAAPTARRLRWGDLVLVDFGARSGIGESDLSRTILIGEADEEQKNVHDTVRVAQEMAVGAIRPGAHSGEIHRAAQKHIAAAGYGKYFVHGLGHSIGAGPDLSPREGERLRPGHVVTVEPGIYIPDWGGVRIEDVVQVTEEGVRMLTHSSRLLLEV